MVQYALNKKITIFLEDSVLQKINEISYNNQLDNPSEIIREAISLYISKGNFKTPHKSPYGILNNIYSLRIDEPTLNELKNIQRFIDRSTSALCRCAIIEYIEAVKENE